MRDLQLYVITDRSVIGDKALIHIVEAAIEGGAEVIQLRDKNVSARELVEIGKELRALCRDKGVLFIINDRPDVAVAIDCDGVHLGQDDLPIEAARRVVGPDRIIGVSTHSLDQAVRAQEQGADYIGVGWGSATDSWRPSVHPITRQSGCCETMPRPEPLRSVTREESTGISDRVVS
ncbi:MAG: thiamine phosphate synthase [Candidatus Omnitrophica bacterium]|nr:thiamine phosphate synthase [Candidatus Omnitrophota bacterium]